jgi:hypothetical protein
MKHLLLLVFLPGMSAVASIAPDSIAGKVYHEYSDIPSVRRFDQRTVVFRADGRFVYLKLASGSPLIVTAPDKVFIQNPPNDGSYIYRRTGESTGTMDLLFDGGGQSTIDLNFYSPTTGGSPNPSTSGAPNSFFLSDLAALDSAPAVNVSLRGRVSEGRPLIAGFVVPGPIDPASVGIVPPPQNTTREILIRVVGPSLAQYGITGAWADPDFRLFHGSEPANVNEFHYNDWSSNAGSKKIFGYVGAFPLLDGSKDSADVVRLSPGVYTIVCNAVAGDPGGEALIEVYSLP